MLKNKRTGKSGIKMRLLALVVALSCVAPLCACADTDTGNTLSVSERKESIRNSKNDQLIHSSIVDLLGFDIDSSYIEDIEMISESQDGSNGKILMLIKEGKETDLINFLKSKLGDYKNVDASVIPPYQDQYTLDLKQMKFIKNFVASKTVDVVKTVNINVYVAQKGKYTYMFIFGQS